MSAQHTTPPHAHRWQIRHTAASIQLPLAHANHVVRHAVSERAIGHLRRETAWLRWIVEVLAAGDVRSDRGARSSSVSW